MQDVYNSTIYDLLRKKGEIPDMDEPMSYIYGMANVIIMRYLDNKELTYLSNEQLAKYIDPDTERNDNEETEQYSKSLKSIAKELKPSYRAIIEDYWFNFKTEEQICKERGYKSHEIFSSMRSQALDAMRKKIEEIGNHYILKCYLKRMIKLRNGKQ